MIIDFSCREALGILDYVVPAIPGALTVLIIVAGLAFIGRLITRNQTFQATDIFVGWGVVAGIMTLAAIIFEKPLLLSAFIIFALMLVGLFFNMKSRYFAAPFWILALFPGLFILTAINAMGLGGGFFYDDYSHWIPNALYLFQHDDIPSKALPAVHSIYPGYPYALPFLTYLSSLLAGGFLVQGGAMINFMLLLAFAALMVETTEKHDKTPAKFFITWRTLGLTALTLLLGVFLNSTISTFGLTNQGDTGTMVLCGALGLMLWRISEDLASKRKAENIGKYSQYISLIAVAFVLLKQSNIILLFFLCFAFLVISWRNGVLKRAGAKLPVMLLPAFMGCLLWQYYANAEVGGGGVGIAPLSAWRFDLFVPLLYGIYSEIMWKSVFFVLFIGTIGSGIVCLFRSKTPWRNFVIFSAIVQIGYAAFLILAFLGSDFTEYTIKLAASFHRYMLHAVFLAFPAFWIAVYALGLNMKDKIKIPKILLAPNSGKSATVLILFALPIIVSFAPDVIVLRADSNTCFVRRLTHKAARAFPNETELGFISPKDTGYSAFVIGLELALEEARSGRSMKLGWHSDSFHTYTEPDSKNVEKQLKDHPETNALIFTPDAYDLLKPHGIKDEIGSGLLLRDGNKWKARRL